MWPNEDTPRKRAPASPTASPTCPRLPLLCPRMSVTATVQSNVQLQRAPTDARCSNNRRPRRRAAQPRADCPAELDQCVSATDSEKNHGPERWQREPPHRRARGSHGLLKRVGLQAGPYPTLHMCKQDFLKRTLDEFPVSGNEDKRPPPGPSSDAGTIFVPSSLHTSRVRADSPLQRTARA